MRYDINRLPSNWTWLLSKYCERASIIDCSCWKRFAPVWIFIVRSATRKQCKRFPAMDMLGWTGTNVFIAWQLYALTNFYWFLIFQENHPTSLMITLTVGLCDLIFHRRKSLRTRRWVWFSQFLPKKQCFLTALWFKGECVRKNNIQNYIDLPQVYAPKTWGMLAKRAT